VPCTLKMAATAGRLLRTSLVQHACCFLKNVLDKCIVSGSGQVKFTFSTNFPRLRCAFSRSRPCTTTSLHNLPQRVIKHLSVNDLPVGRSMEETLRLFVETHGEVFPANWTPDSPTIKPHPMASKEYFEK
ncbi:hypothetical protein E2I00_018216, partial [Balaenoptera physalus]